MPTHKHTDFTDKKPPVRYGIDEFTNTANVTNQANYQAAKIEEPKTIDDVKK